MTETAKVRLLNLNICIGYLDIGHWNLFGAWDLVIGYSKRFYSQEA
jgi:hypothetical protein